MNGRKLFREYAKSKGKDVKEFVKIEEDLFKFYPDVLITKDSSGDLNRTTLDYKEVVHWIIRTYNLENKTI